MEELLNALPLMLQNEDGMVTERVGRQQKPPWTG